MISIFICAYLLAIPGQAIKADSTIAESWNQMFLTKSGWIGGDAVYSVPVQNKNFFLQPSRITLVTRWTGKFSMTRFLFFKETKTER